MAFKFKKGFFGKIKDALTLALVRIFGQSYQNGNLVLSNGFHEIQVNTHKTPNRVWLTFQLENDQTNEDQTNEDVNKNEDEENEDEENTNVYEKITFPVCHANVDKFGYQINNKGFVLIAEINTVSRNVAWFATL